MPLSLLSRRLFIALVSVLLILNTSFISSVAAQGPTNPDKEAYEEPVPIPQDPTAPVVPEPLSVQFVSSEPGFAATIPDNGYIGTLDGNDAFGTDAGMSCINIDTATALPAGKTVNSVTVGASINHTWIGDLTVKVRSPSGTILTVLNRPVSTAADDGADSPVGDSSNWNGSLITFGDGLGPEAETMGASLTDTQNICANDGVCAHDPSPDTATQPPAAFGAFRGQAATGVWTMCVGDSVELDSGTFNQFRLTLTAADPYTASPATSIPDDGYTGGFGGIGQACSIINTTSPAPSSATVLGTAMSATVSHTWVGDLTMKLRSPNGTILTVLNRPGSTALDDGTGAVGEDANWSGSPILFGDGWGPEAELMGTALTTGQRICLDNAVCAHDPSPDTATQPPTAFSNFNGGAAAGNWTLCMGDSALGDVGMLNSWTLYLARAPISLAVDLESFAATATDSGVNVTWETANEIDNLGFNLYRSTDAALTGDLLTPELIPSTAPGSGQGSAYAFTDTTVAQGVTYYYSLQDVDLNGTSVMHPAVQVTPGEATAVNVGTVGITTNAPYDRAMPLVAGVALLGMVGVLLLRRYR